jgi:ATP-dependent Lon protease
MEKSQREYYLNEQMKAIQKELGDLSEEGGSELDELARKIEKAGMPKDVRAKADAELKKLRMMSPMSAEATVVRNYIDWLVGVPWRKRSKITKDLKRAKAILDADHYGLEDVKERILEYLAVQERVGNSRGPICVWLVRPVLVKPVWAAPLRKQPIANLCGCLWAEYVMKRKFADIGGLISAHCREKLSRVWPRWQPATR